MAQTVKPVQLQPPTVKAFDTYIRAAETEMEQSLRGSGPFLWSDLAPARVEEVARGRVLVQLWSGKGPVKVPNGLIHDWIGAILVPNSTIHEVLTVIQQYDNHKNLYQPEVIDSKLTRRDGNHFQIYLRILKKKIITVVLDTEHEVQYRAVDRKRWVCHSHTTRIAEVEHAGTRDEQVFQSDTGFGFLWRLHSYWRFEERSLGVVVECRAISLTRDIPRGLGWIVEPIIQKLPKESLIKTLEATRQALHVRTKMPLRT